MAVASKQTSASTASKGKGDNEDEVIQTSEIDSSSWRLRDMAYRLLYHRYGPESETVPPRSSSSNMHVAEFEPDSCLLRIRRDKSAVVRSAFDAAATAVLEALEKSIQQHAKKQRRKSLAFQQNDLPPFLNQWLQLEELRLSSMERAHNNKDYARRPLPPDAKRMGRKTTTLPSTDPTTSSLADNNNANKPSTESNGKPETAAPFVPKFTRNTPASSTAALDSRYTNSRAILCTAGSVCFDALTPPLPGFDIDVTDIPQNPNKLEDPSASTVNMGNVVVEAQAVGQRAIAVTVNASRRAALRYQYRADNIKFGRKSALFGGNKALFRMKNRFQWKEPSNNIDNPQSDEDDAFFYNEETIIPYQPQHEAVTELWSETCLPRFLSILKSGSHCLYHDVEWWTRHGRTANLFQVMAQEQGIYGTHLIITTEPEIVRFAQEFQPVNRHLTLLGSVNAEGLRALAYTGDKEQRKSLRLLFNKATGLLDSPYHVLITSYRAFLEDYFHFCQVPFHSVVLDDGASWLGAAKGDPNSPIATVWDTAIFSTKDHVGLAATSNKKWDFSLDEIPADTLREAWIGLTARSRILVASVLEVQQRNSIDVIPVSGLVEFVAPIFASVAKEEWDRSRIFTDGCSMEHFRKLLTRSTIVYHPLRQQQDLRSLAMDALNGRLPAPDRSRDPVVPEVISDETFVNDNKVAFSRRGALSWLGISPERSWLRYELGMVSFKPILDSFTRSSMCGHCCEEIVTASSTTSTGATGQVAGTLAYRLAVRCNRHFGSEQGLRQHLSAVHAPPGTWLCRTCGADCVTSQARTHHERSCGQPEVAPHSKENGQGTGKRQNFGPVGVVGKKQSKARHGATAQGNTAPEDKDPDGSFRVLGYRGVWVNPKGKHFVKMKGKKLPHYFDSIEDAAKAHDAAVKQPSGDPKAELNFQEDGTRIVYEEVSTAGSTGLGGSASNVVPALSVINIKDLPADVKPLLRDPRQTSRTGGNSKRHVYAYRGVCRQARKGHDRWQSQISFMGVNHYLGTFDSEWDAAAIYAWAHLILYGAEATLKAQREGEEAAAAYEQEKKMIEEGKLVPPPPKADKKKPKTQRKPKEKKGETKKEGAGQAKKGEGAASKKRKVSGDDEDDGGDARKKGKPGPKRQKVEDKEALAPILAKGASRAWSLAPRDQYLNKGHADLVALAGARIVPAQDSGFRLVDPNHPPTVDDLLRPCRKVSDSSTTSGAAMLLGLSATLFGWDVELFCSNRVFDSPEQERDATSALAAEYSTDGSNESFRALMEGTLCVIGNASPLTRKAHKQLGLGKIQIGASVGEIDCNVGGAALTCSETAATIRYAPTSAGDFQFTALNDDDIVTLNGRRVTPGMGSFPLFNEDICTVGARVFLFLLPR
ncbi:expressed unknown protein [Seminavis robusta]|uniref:AP2/ERF domain-containing protein n=1 Tax=Seminavis robusta TaxID=568900 RepID=A0A9N8ETJ1_9STRA|nr:expressed unknown protein [Seminavis robusta]|eukprot:Sro1909_g304810.1 n/a (1385) ;mRNA; f:5434-10175